MKRAYLVGAAILGACIAWYLLFMFYKPPTLVPQETPAPLGGQPILPIKTMTIGKTVLAVEVATTPAQKSKGLSGRIALGEGRGMLFVFDESSAGGFWMKDMHFPIDIIWIDTDKKIVTIFENLSPETYPTVFRPATPAQYVLEVPAGFSAKQGIVVGDEVVL